MERDGRWAMNMYDTDLSNSSFHDGYFEGWVTPGLRYVAGAAWYTKVCASESEAFMWLFPNRSQCRVRFLRMTCQTLSSQ